MTGPAGARGGRSVSGRVGIATPGVVASGVSMALAAASMISASPPHPGSRGQHELQRYFDVTADSSLPAWWSTSLLLVCALAHAVTGFATRLGQVRGAWSWFIGAVVLAVLSLNEHALLSERVETLSGAVVTVTGFPRPVLAAGVAAGLVAATALVVLAVRERGRTRWLLVVGASLLAGGALADGYLPPNPAGWLGSTAGALLLTAAAVSAVSVTPGREGVRLRHRRAAPPVGVATPTPAATQEQEVPA